MTPHQTLAVAVRLFAIVVALYAVRDLLGFYVAGRERSDAWALPLVAVFFALSVALVLVLWFFPKSIARGLLPVSADAPATPSAPDAWLAIGSALIGLWLVATALPALARNLVLLYLFRAESAMDRSGLMDGLLFYVGQLAIGMALIFGAKGIKNFLSWARTAGSRDTTP
jgi:hypothetical protein